MKKETLKEAAERMVKETTLYGNKNSPIGSSDRSYFETELRCVLLGIKYQQERSYSEEDLKQAFQSGFTNGLNINIVTFEEWFEQFKNK